MSFQHRLSHRIIGCHSNEAFDSDVAQFVVGRCSFRTSLQASSHKSDTEGRAAVFPSYSSAHHATAEMQKMVNCGQFVVFG
jgi:hypothetical protein